MHLVVSAGRPAVGGYEIGAVVVVDTRLRRSEGRAADDEIGARFPNAPHHQIRQHAIVEQVKGYGRFGPDDEIDRRGDALGQGEILIHGTLLKDRVPLGHLVDVSLNNRGPKRRRRRYRLFRRLDAMRAVGPDASYGDQEGRKADIRTDECRRPPQPRAHSISGRKKNGGVAHDDQVRNPVYSPYIRNLDEMQMAVLGISQKLPRKTREKKRPEILESCPCRRGHKDRRRANLSDGRPHPGKQADIKRKIGRQEKQRGDGEDPRKAAIGVHGVDQPVDQRQVMDHPGDHAPAEGPPTGCLRQCRHERQQGEPRDPIQAGIGKGGRQQQTGGGGQQIA